MNLGLQEKNAVVLAGSKGLGKAVAVYLVKEGCNVTICSRNEKHLQKTVAELKRINSEARIFSASVDLSVASSIEQFFEYVRKNMDSLDILITNAGGPRSAGIEEISPEDWDYAFRQNFMSVVHAVQKALPIMKQQKSGRIVSVTATTVKNPLPNMALSNALRAAITGFIKTVSKEYAAYNILANTVCPGFIATERIQELAESEAKRREIGKEQVLEEFISKIPLGRMGTPEEFASLVAYLCSEPARYITGATFWADGGSHPGLL